MHIVTVKLATCTDRVGKSDPVRTSKLADSLETSSLSAMRLAIVTFVIAYLGTYYLTRWVRASLVCPCVVLV